MSIFINKILLKVKRINKPLLFYQIKGGGVNILWLKNSVLCLQIMVCIYAVWLVGFIKLMDDAFWVLICGSVLCL
ncbi:hypothetical protein [Moraxella lacunata]|uniref:hypothetical protein n=1 Tax=Moraxella lacunata TaxID=477 RepID=UPI003EDFA874